MKGVIDLLHDTYAMVHVWWLDWHLARCAPEAPCRGAMQFKRNRLARGHRRLEYRLPA